MNPEEIQVDEDVVRVKYHWNPRGETTGDGVYLSGGDYENNKIRLATGYTRRGLRQGLMHELGHKIVEKSGLAEHLAALLSKKQAEALEESVVDAFAVFIPLILRQNPKLVKWLTEELP